MERDKKAAPIEPHSPIGATMKSDHEVHVIAMTLTR
jgi:hypothetical protein